MVNTIPAPPAAASAQLFELLQGPIRWQLVEAGLTLGLFEKLHQSKTAEQLAVSSGYQIEATRRWLNAVVSLGLLTLNQGKYTLAPSFVDLLGGASAKHMKPVLLHLARLRHGSVAQIQAALEGRTDTQPHLSRSIDQPAFWKKATAHLQAFHRSCATEVGVSILTNLPVWPKVRNMLDLGAGSAELAISLLGASPDLHCTLFDLPASLQQIRLSVFAEEAHRITWAEGNYNQTPLPAEMDLIWASMSLYYADDLNLLVAQIHDCLKPGGVFVSVHEGLNRERTQPSEHVINRFMPALVGRDVSFEYGEIASAMSKAGFRQIIRRPLHTSYGRFELDLAYV